MANNEKNIDDNQRKYREVFGIKDSFLIQMSYDENNNGFIVFLDEDDDIDWVDNRTIGADVLKERDAYITKLNTVLYEPCPNLSKEDAIAFKKILGSGYVLAIEGKYEEIRPLIEQAQHFLKQRNREKARQMFLISSGIASLLAIAFNVANVCCWGWYSLWTTAVTMGVLGAFVSVWMRYGKIALTGISSRWLHYLESFTRLLVGGITAIIAVCAVKCGLFLANLSLDTSLYAFALIGFAAGFSERLIPSLMERITDNKQ